MTSAARDLPETSGGPLATAAAASVPAAILLGHLLGGASDAVAGLVLTSALCLICLALCLIEQRPYPARFIVGARWAGVPFAALLACALVAIMPGSAGLGSGSLAEVIRARTLAVDPSAAGLEIVKLLGLAVMVLAAERIALSARRLRLTLRLLIAAGSVWTLWALVLFAIAAGESAAIRLSGAFISPNVAGAVIVMTLLLLIGETVPGQDPDGAPFAQRRRRAVPAALGLLLLTGLVLTASRASVLIGLVLCVGLWGWRRRAALTAGLQGRDPLGWAAGLVGVVGGACALFAGATLLARLPHTSADADDRWAIMQIFARAAAQSPLTGHGLGSAPALSRLLLDADNYDVFWNIRAAHNVIVQWWVEGGAIGLGLAAATLAILGVHTWRGLGKVGRDGMAGPLLCLVFLAAHGMVDYDLQIYSVALTAALLLGLCLAGSAHGQTYWLRLARERFGKRSARVERASPNPEPAARLPGW